MSNKFKSILVPVDFSENTEVAIKKAIGFSGEDTVIHLLNVQMDLILGLSPRTHQYVIDKTIRGNRDVVEENLQNWKRAIEESSNAKVRTWLVYHSSIPAVIERRAIILKADLIIIGKNSSHSWFPFLNTVVPSVIAEQAGIPVLTVKPGSLHNKTQKVIVPITSELPNHKMEMIDALRNTFKVKVFLVSFMENGKPSDFNVSSLLQAYRQLKMKPGCSVGYTVLHGSNKAKELLQYAEKINADMLLVHPQTETKIGWLNRQISDMLPPESKVQVLTVRPGN